MGPGNERRVVWRRPIANGSRRTWCRQKTFAISYLACCEFHGIHTDTLVCIPFFFSSALEQVWPVSAFLGTVTGGIMIHVFLDCAAATAACRQVLSAQEALKDDDVTIEKAFTMNKKVKERVAD